MEKKRTYFIDIDGTIFKYRKFDTMRKVKAELNPNMEEFINMLKDNHHMVIITSARPEYLYQFTVDELVENNIPYDRIILGIERGPRYIINDLEPGKPWKRAVGINVERDKGLHLNLDNPLKELT
jgi:uncharacterized HAD superfamily protein